MKWVICSLVMVGIAACSQIHKSPKSSISDVDSSKYNVVFLLVDDLGYSDIGAFNPNTFYATPNIDALARKGVKFTNGYAASPVCSPSRVAIMTGKHPTRLKATDWFSKSNRPDRVERFQPARRSNEMSLDEVTIGEIFQQNGYSTAFMGKWHLGESEELWPEYQGFEVNKGGANFGHPPGGYFSPYRNPRLADGPKGEYLTDRLTKEAVEYIEGNRKKENPFFLFLSYYTVHVPLEAPSDIVQNYADPNIDFLAAENFHLEAQHHVSTNADREVRTVQNHPTYAAMIEKLDDSVGQIIRSLEENNLDEDTIIVFTSDNGGLSSAEGSPTSNFPLRTGKGWLYEGGIKVPLIIRIPGNETVGEIVETPVVGTDFMPTLSALLNLNANNPEQWDGVDFLSPRTHESEAPERSIVWHYPHYSNQGGFPGAAIRLGDWKLLQNFEDGKVELYNLRTDVAEQTNLSDQNPQKTKEMQNLLEDWYLIQDAEFLRELPLGKELPWRPEPQLGQ